MFESRQFSDPPETGLCVLKCRILALFRANRPTGVMDDRSGTLRDGDMSFVSATSYIQHTTMPYPRQTPRASLRATLRRFSF